MKHPQQLHWCLPTHTTCWHDNVSQDSISLLAVGSAGCVSCYGNLYHRMELGCQHIIVLSIDTSGLSCLPVRIPFACRLQNAPCNFQLFGMMAKYSLPILHWGLRNVFPRLHLQGALALAWWLPLLYGSRSIMVSEIARIRPLWGRWGFWIWAHVRVVVVRHGHKILQGQVDH